GRPPTKWSELPRRCPSHDNVRVSSPPLRLDRPSQVLRITSSREMCRTSRLGHGDLVEDVVTSDTFGVTHRSAGSAAGDAIVGYRAFVAVVVAAYFTFIALTPRQSWMPVVSWVQLLPLSGLYLAL